MSSRFTRSVLAATIVASTFAGWGSRVALAGDDKMAVTAVGCLQSEREYRRQHHSSKFAGTGVGLNDEYILIDAVIGDLRRTRMHCRVAVIAVAAAEEPRIAVPVEIERAAHVARPLGEREPALHAGLARLREPARGVRQAETARGRASEHIGGVIAPRPPRPRRRGHRRDLVGVG